MKKRRICKTRFDIWNWRYVCNGFERKEARYIPRVSRVNVFSGYVVISVMDVLTSKSRVYLWKRRHLEFHEIISKTDLV